LPTTKPTGSKPACLISRNSLTLRSEVNRPAWFCCRRALPASGTPSSEVGSYVLSVSSVSLMLALLLVGSLVCSSAPFEDCSKLCRQIDGRLGCVRDRRAVLADRRTDHMESHHQPAA